MNVYMHACMYDVYGSIYVCIHTCIIYDVFMCMLVCLNVDMKKCLYCFEGMYLLHSCV